MLWTYKLLFENVQFRMSSTHDLLTFAQQQTWVSLEITIQIVNPRTTQK